MKNTLTVFLCCLATNLLTGLPAHMAFADTPAKVGFIAPLTGPRASFGQDALEAAKIAIRDLNAPIELFVEDSQGDPRQGTSAWQSLKARGIKFIITMNSNVSLAVAGLVANDNIIQLAISTTADSYSTPNDNTFRINGSTRDEARAQVAFLSERLKMNPGTLAVLTIEDEYPASLRANAIAELSKAGITPVLDETFAPKETDFRSLLSRLRASHASYLLLLSYQTEAGLLIKQLKQQKIPIHLILASTPLRNREFFETAGDAAEGTLITYFKLNERMPAAQHLKEAGLTVNIPSSNGYDAILVTNEAFKQCQYKTEPECLKKALYAVKGIEGVSGTKTMDAVYGDMQDHYQIMEAKGGGFVPFH